MTFDERPAQAPVVTPPPVAEEPSPPAEVRRVTLSTYIGNTIEYYDFILYGSAAALIFGPLFFSNLTPAVATLASFATLATGYLCRPLGGLLFGHLGDRFGRKPTLLATMILMGLASGFIGLLPTSEQIGLWAPILLVVLRLLQGLSVGGEWGGAALMTAEHAPAARRGLITAIGQAGQPTGGALATAALALVALLPDDQLFSWGWRIPFLVSFALLAVALYIRLRISESPLFVELEATQSRQHATRTPLAHLFRQQPGAVGRGLLLSIPPSLMVALVSVFCVSYAVSAGHARSTVLTAVGCAFAVSIVTGPLYGRLSDRYGRRPVYAAGTVGFAVLAYPLFWAIDSGSTSLLFLAVVVAFAVVTQPIGAGLAAMLSELFATNIRYTGVSLSYQVAAVISGLFPLAAASLLAVGGGSPVWVALLVVVIAVLSTAMVLSMRESTGRRLDKIENGSIR